MKLFENRSQQEKKEWRCLMRWRFYLIWSFLFQEWWSTVLRTDWGGLVLQYTLPWWCTPVKLNNIQKLQMTRGEITAGEQNCDNVQVSDWRDQSECECTNVCKQPAASKLCVTSGSLAIVYAALKVNHRHIPENPRVKPSVTPLSLKACLVAQGKQGAAHQGNSNQI